MIAAASDPGQTHTRESSVSRFQSWRRHRDRNVCGLGPWLWRVASIVAHKRPIRTASVRRPPVVRRVNEI